MLRARASLLFAVVLSICAVAGACGSDQPGIFTFGNDSGVADDSASGSDGTTGFVAPDGSVPTGPLVISPADAVINVTAGTTIAPVNYTATVGGVAVTPSWSIDRGELGAIDVSSGAFKASAQLGGKGTISATFGSSTATTSVTVFLHVVQNGGGVDDDPGTGDAGAGGFGGVGGFGVGAAYANPAIFPGSPTADPVALLYPYDGTVWPRGLLPPLLQWTNDQAWDGLYIHIQEDNYDYVGTFSKPATASVFDDHPIPVDAWKQMAESNAGESVTITVELSLAGVPYGPMVEHWKVASAPLKGTVYYNSYGTSQALNYPQAVGGPAGEYAKPDGHRFGAATLAIRGNATSPVLVAGSSTSDTSGCRVCHSVSGDGSTLITKWADDVTSSVYDLHGTYGSNETYVPAGINIAWPAVSQNGTFAFSDSSGAPGSTSTASTLYWLPSGDTMTATNLPAGLRAAFPAFSPDGSHVAFTWYGGTVASVGTGDTNTLAMMDFTGPSGLEDAGGGGTFGTLTPLFNPASSTVGVRALYPSFLPTSDGIVFENELVDNNRGGTYAETRSTCDNAALPCGNSGAQAELWWIDLTTKTPYRLSNLNGDSYLPTGGAHTAAQDEQLNYEPTVNPVASGGYAWIVFTSRRLYGNVATRGAYESDPRNFDLTTSPTPKKLWVAAIDLNAPAGTDPSHPAFYLPAQELFAGNSRGYWVVDPCASDGTSCATGDECCGGFCRPGSDGGLICTDTKPACAQEFEKCAVNTDCCGNATGILCIGNRCAAPTPR